MHKKTFDNSNIKIGVVLCTIMIIVAFIVVWFGSKKQELTAGEKALIEYQESIPKLQKNLEADPTNIRFNNEYAYSLYVTQHQDAIAAYQKALEFDSENDKSLNNLGNLFRKTGQYEPAAEAYTAAIEANKSNLNAYINKSHMYIYDLKQLDEGYQTLITGIENNPENIMLRLVLAKIYEQQDLVDEANALYEEVLVLDPDHAVAKEKVK